MPPFVLGGKDGYKGVNANRAFYGIIQALFTSRFLAFNYFWKTKIQ
jgi:hypothetical protein